MKGIGIAAGQTFTEIDTLVLRSLGADGGGTRPSIARVGTSCSTTGEGALDV